MDIEEIRERFKKGMNDESKLRKAIVADYRFRFGEQWESATEQKRKRELRPVITTNKISQIVNQIVGEQRVHRPSITVHPTDGQVSKETADIVKGMIRAIKRRSKSGAAYDYASDAAITAGRGFVRIVTEYIDEETLDQEIIIKGVPDPLSVLLDPSYKQVDGSDAKWGFYFESMDEDEFKKKYPKAKLDEKFEGVDNWKKDKQITIAEYYKIVEEKETIEINGIKREVVRKKVTQVLTNGFEKLSEETTIPCSYIPIIPIHGGFSVVEGRKNIEGIVRHVKDNQRMFNLLSSTKIEMINLMPKVGWIGAKGQFGEDIDEWIRAGHRPKAVLEHEPVDESGKPAPPPMRANQEPPIVGLLSAIENCRKDFRDITGVYQSSVGDMGAARSGKAIEAEAGQGRMSNSHYTENMKKSILHVGQISVEMIPKVYNTARVVEITGEAGEAEQVLINQLIEEKNKGYFIKEGRYSVEISAGTDHRTKQQELARVLTDISKVYPKMWEVAGDIIVNNLEIPQAQDIAERIKRLMPQQVFTPREDMTPDEMKSALERADVEIDNLNKITEILNQKIENKEIELSKKAEMEAKKIEADLEIAREKIRVERDKIVFEATKADISIDFLKEEDHG